MVPQKWLNEALNMSIFRDKPYLRFTEYASYNRLWELSKTVELVKNFCLEETIREDKCRILDIGCGTGNIAIPLAHLDYDVTGVDINLNAIARANERKKGLNNAKFICSDALEYLENYQGQAFHIVICAHVLEHLQDPERLCSDVSKVVLERGIFVLLVPNLLGISELLFGRPGVIKKILGIKTIPGRDHIQSFTLGRLRKMISASGFQFKSVSSVASILCLPFLARSRLALLELRFPIPWLLAQTWVVSASPTKQPPQI